MYLTLLEYVFVRVAFGAVVLAFRAAGLLVLAVLWLAGALLRLVLRPLSRELAHALGRVLGHARVAVSRRRGAGQIARAARP